MITQRRVVSRIGLACLSLLGIFTPSSVSLNDVGTKKASIPLTISSGTVSASTLKNYTPPVGRPRPQRTEGSGSRGCTNSIPVTVNLLTPGDHIARTTLGRPTFLWHVSDASSVPIVFTITAPGSDQPIFHKQMKADKAGIMGLQLPSDVPELAVGQEYRWTVALICNEKRPSMNVNARAWIERVDSTPNLSSQLKNARNDRDRALIYTKAGVWYDGVAILSQLQEKNPREKLASNSLASLLEEVGLTKVASLERQRSAN